jgi:hypothetical protein
MEERSGWLERSLTRARENIKARPEHLKPERYRSKGKIGKASAKKGGGASRAA